MKTLQKITLIIVSIGLFTSCQSKTDVNQILSNSDTKKAIMDTIANNSDMSKDMMQAMMNSSKGKMMMTNHENMMKMINPFLKCW